MKRLMIAASVAMFAVCAAAADTVKDGSISVTPGRWLWKQETNVMAIPIKEENIECLIPEKSEITLSKLARDLEEGCTVDNVRPIPTGYLFKLKCSGKTKGDADATLIHTSKSMTINAKGSAMLGFIPAGFSMKAQATYMGECTPDEARKEKERWLKDHPEAATPSP